ncbi:hypothetical protein [Methylobacterium brachiatum]|uniref:hypothetical protein n=1 Tax=Methylobacterium brachiatum TaxID=269660 RepID=UPI0013CE9D43|nr:hypothetical protein [Methylobacterium brachiatum]
MPTLAQPTAELWNTIFNVVLVLGAIAVLAGTWGAFWTGNMKEFYSNERISANEAQTAAANASAEQAREGAARADERAGKANEAAAELQVRAGQLERDAAHARVEQERLKAQNLQLQMQILAQGPRNITIDQSNKIAASVSAEPNKPKIIFDYFNEPETHRFMNILGASFMEGGLECSAGQAFINTIEQGIQVWDRTGAVQRAFRAAGIIFKDMTSENSDKPTTIQVGSKPY